VTGFGGAPGAAFLAGVIAGYAIALPVGAVATYLVGLAARHPWRVGAAGALGVATVDGGYGLLAALGGVAVADVVEPVATPLRVVAAVVLVTLAVRGAVAALRDHRALPRDGERSPSLTPARAFGRFVAVTAVNPATVLFFVTVVAGSRLVPDAAATGRLGAAALFGLGAFVSSASWQLVLASAGTALGRALSGPRGRLGTALASSSLMIALAVLMLLS
jgi:threonine/homoserine/homoserine lactone efflux protein